MEFPKYYREAFEESFVKYYDFCIKLTMLGKEDKVRSKIFSSFPKRIDRILEMACGTGSNLVLIKNRYKDSEVYGVDLSGEMLRIAKKKCKNLILSRQNIENTNFKENYFDVVLISLGLHEVPLEIRDKIIKEAYRILKKNGRFIVFDMGMPKNIILKGIFLIFIRLFEPYGKSFIKQDIVKELNKNKFKNSKRFSYYNNLVQIVHGEK